MLAWYVFTTTSSLQLALGTLKLCATAAAVT